MQRSEGELGAAIANHSDPVAAYHVPITACFSVFPQKASRGLNFSQFNSVAKLVCQREVLGIVD